MHKVPWPCLVLVGRLCIDSLSLHPRGADARTSFLARQLKLLSFPIAAPDESLRADVALRASRL
jgi:hypothetical protein